MGLTGPIPNHILKLMPKQERPAGVAGMTAAECDDKFKERLEKRLHEVFEGWCKVTQLPYVHSRMDRKSTIAQGWPDFTVLHGREVVCVEFKALDGKLRPEQIEVIAGLQNQGVPVLVSNDVAEAIAWVKGQFKL